MIVKAIKKMFNIKDNQEGVLDENREKLKRYYATRAIKMHTKSMRRNLDRGNCRYMGTLPPIPDVSKMSDSLVKAKLKKLGL
jgi:hypothetical protein